MRLGYILVSLVLLASVGVVAAASLEGDITGTTAQISLVPGEAPKSCDNAMELQSGYYVKFNVIGGAAEHSDIQMQAYLAKVNKDGSLGPCYKCEKEGESYNNITEYGCIVGATGGYKVVAKIRDKWYSVQDPTTITQVVKIWYGWGSADGLYAGGSATFPQIDTAKKLQLVFDVFGVDPEDIYEATLVAQNGKEYRSLNIKIKSIGQGTEIISATSDGQWDPLPDFMREGGTFDGNLTITLKNGGEILIPIILRLRERAPQAPSEETINISADKQEYKVGDKITIKVNAENVTQDDPKYLCVKSADEPDAEWKRVCQLFQNIETITIFTEYDMGIQTMTPSESSENQNTSIHFPYSDREQKISITVCKLSNGKYVPVNSANRIEITLQEPEKRDAEDYEQIYSNYVEGWRGECDGTDMVQISTPRNAKEDVVVRVRLQTKDGCKETGWVPIISDTATPLAGDAVIEKTDNSLDLAKFYTVSLWYLLDHFASTKNGSCDKNEIRVVFIRKKENGYEVSERSATICTPITSATKKGTWVPGKDWKFTIRNGYNSGKSEYYRIFCGDYPITRWVKIDSSPFEGHVDTMKLFEKDSNILLCKTATIELGGPQMYHGHVLANVDVRMVNLNDSVNIRTDKEKENIVIEDRDNKISEVWKFCVDAEDVCNLGVYNPPSSQIYKLALKVNHNTNTKEYRTSPCNSFTCFLMKLLNDKGYGIACVDKDGEVKYCS